MLQSGKLGFPFLRVSAAETFLSTFADFKELKIILMNKNLLFHF